MHAHHKLARKNAILITCYVTKLMCSDIRHAQLPARLCHTRLKCLLVAIKLLQQLLMLLLNGLCQRLLCCCSCHKLMLSEGSRNNWWQQLQQSVDCHHLKQDSNLGQQSYRVGQVGCVN